MDGVRRINWWPAVGALSRDSVAEACSAGYVVANPATNPGLVRDCETLAGLRDALIGRMLVNWTADTAIRDVIIDGTPPRVTPEDIQPMRREILGS